MRPDSQPKIREKEVSARSSQVMSGWSASCSAMISTIESATAAFDRRSRVFTEGMMLSRERVDADVPEGQFRLRSVREERQNTASTELGAEQILFPVFDDQVRLISMSQ